MGGVIRGLEVVFGKGDSDHALWLAAVRIDVLLFVSCGGAVLLWTLRPARLRTLRGAGPDLAAVLGLTALAAALRFAVQYNLSDFGGIGYSRILVGYKGHFGAAQLYSLLYERAGRDLEHAVLLNRLAATATVVLVYALCRRLLPQQRAFAVCTAALLALHPLHVLFAASDALPISTSLVAAAAYLLLAIAVEDSDTPDRVRMTAAVGAAAGLALVTQIRYENALFLLPPLIYLWVRRTPRLARLWPAAAVVAIFLSAFALAALTAGTSFQNPINVAEVGRALGRELAGNPIFAVGPLVIGTAAAVLSRRSAVRRWAALPLLSILPLAAVVSAQGPHLARTYVNEVLALVLVAGYGLAVLWASDRPAARAVVLAALLWAAVLPALFWETLRERHLETADHDFFRAALIGLPPGIDRVVVADDAQLLRETHSTMESMIKYRAIAAAVRPDVEVVAASHFFADGAGPDCQRGNCAVFRGVFCFGLRRYWFADAQCEQLMRHAGAALREEEIAGGSFVDCSVYRGALRRELCEPFRVTQRFGLYRFTTEGTEGP